jgi:hypothetical protein
MPISMHHSDPGLFIPYQQQQHNDYLASMQQQHHNLHGGPTVAMTHLTHAPHTPIMTTQQIVGLDHHQHQQQQYYQQPQVVYAHHAAQQPSRRYDGATYYDQRALPRARGGGYRDPSREVTKIPPRFQKQR